MLDLKKKKKKNLASVFSALCLSRSVNATQMKKYPSLTLLTCVGVRCPGNQLCVMSQRALISSGYRKQPHASVHNFLAFFVDCLVFVALQTCGRLSKASAGSLAVNREFSIPSSDNTVCFKINPTRLQHPESQIYSKPKKMPIRKTDMGPLKTNGLAACYQQAPPSGAAVTG